MRKLLALLLATALCLSACNAEKSTAEVDPETGPSAPVEESSSKKEFDGTSIVLSDEGITVNGAAISETAGDPVYMAHDIVYYEAGKDFTYGEGEEQDEHSAEEAAAHTVVHITKPGDYSVSGKLSAGQIAIDLGEDAEEDPEAVVNLYLDNADIRCTVAPAVIFYHVYECGSTEEADAKAEVDTSAAGANVYLVDGSVNNIDGSYVARIYKSVELSQDGKTVLDSKKLHKYDAAFYSKQSMNLYGNSGVLNIFAENEGLDSELHLTINGGIINIDSGNDGINTNEDNISVTTVNGGSLFIKVNGSTGEGDGIDSNGWLVINGGEVIAAACGFSADSGIDADMGIQINGGSVLASGNMLDGIDNGGQTYVALSFAKTQEGGSSYSLKNSVGEVIAELSPENDFSSLVFSSGELMEGTYSLWQGEAQLAHSGSDMGGFGFGGGMGGMRPPEMPEGFDPSQIPEAPSDGFKGNFNGGDFKFNEDGTMTLPDGTTIDPEKFKDQRPEGGKGSGPMGRPETQNGSSSEELSGEFQITSGSNHFGGITLLTEGQKS